MKKRSTPKRIAQAVDDDEPRLERRASPLVLKPNGLAKQYPAAVSCYRFVQVISTSTIVSTAKTTKTITATPGTITVVSFSHCGAQKKLAVLLLTHRTDIDYSRAHYDHFRANRCFNYYYSLHINNDY